MDLFDNKRLFTNNNGDFGYKSPHKQKKTVFSPILDSIMSPIEPHWAPLTPLSPIKP